MNKERIFKVLLAPHVSEKATVAGERNNQYVLKVASDAKKNEIKAAVEQLWDVKVRSVQTAVVKGRVKRFGGTEGRTQDWKKAYVSLCEGSSIDFFGAD